MVVVAMDSPKKREEEGERVWMSFFISLEVYELFKQNIYLESLSC